MQQNLTQPLPCEFIKIGLKRDRKELYKMIEDRVDRMIASGFVDEVKKIINMINDIRGNKVDAGISHTRHPLPAMQAIGYKEIAESLGGGMSLDEAVRLIKRSSKRYAKRQFTWFKREDDIHWIDISGIFSAPDILVYVNRMLTELT
jgi:tRNA dimethylallyltransferase